MPARKKLSQNATSDELAAAIQAGTDNRNKYDSNYPNRIFMLALLHKIVDAAGFNSNMDQGAFIKMHVSLLERYIEETVES